MPDLGKPSATFTAPDSWAACVDTIEDFYGKGWSDGLPVVPPTRDLVDRMIAGARRNPNEVIGNIPPRQGIATVETVASCAVMAGCLPAYFPVVLAGVEASLNERFNLNGLQATTNPATPLAIVSGPIVDKLEINSGTNAFGSGVRANATIGRALRLVWTVIGGCYPETGTKCVLGAPGRYTYLIGEAPANPWQPLHREFGADSESGITLIGVDSPSQFAAGGPEKDPAIILRQICEQAAVSWHQINRGGELLLVLNPLIAESLHKHGYTKQRIQEHVFEHGRVSIRKMLDNHHIRRGEGDIQRDVWPQELDDPKFDMRWPVLREPQHLVITVAGGLQASWCATCGGWGYMGGWTTSRPITA